MTTHPATRSLPRSVRTLGALLAASAALVSACGGGSTGVTSVAATSSAPGTTTPPVAPTTTQRGTAAGDETSAPAGSASSDPAPTRTVPVTDPAGPTAPAGVLQAVRWADRGTYDRVVLDFSGPVGGYTVKYVDALTEDPSGNPVDVAGHAVLAVVVQGATRNNAFQTSGTTPLVTYPGPARVSPGLPNVKEVADAGDFEAVLSFGIGLDHKAGFRVLKLTGPDRLVIDVAH